MRWLDPPRLPEKRKPKRPRGETMIKVYLYKDYDYGFDDGHDLEEQMWVQQEGYEGAWISSNDRRFKALRPVLDLLEPNNDEAFLWDEFKAYHLTHAEWDSITDNALLP